MPPAMHGTVPTLLLAAVLACTSAAALAADPLLQCSAPGHAFVFTLQDERGGTMSQAGTPCSFQVRFISDARPTPAMAIANIDYETVSCGNTFTPRGYLRVIPRGMAEARGAMMALPGLDPFACELSAGSTQRLVAWLDARRAPPPAGGR